MDDKKVGFRNKRFVRILIVSGLLLYAVGFLIDMTIIRKHNQKRASVTANDSVDYKEVTIEDIHISGVTFAFNKIESFTSLHKAFYAKYSGYDEYFVEREIPESIESFSKLMGFPITNDDPYSEIHYFKDEEEKLASAIFKYDSIYRDEDSIRIYSLDGCVSEKELDSYDFQNQNNHKRSDLQGISVDIMYANESKDSTDFLASFSYHDKIYYFYMKGTDSPSQSSSGFCKALYENIAKLKGKL